MKKIDGEEYYNLVEISKKFLEDYTEKDIKILFEEGKIYGKKIEKEWYADKEAIDNYIKLFLNEKYFTIGPFEVDLTKVKMNGRILDIGGGGE
ncbi:MAG: hypothetical protein ACXAEX_06690, partial [Promethearchaeota archaeon]